jgi:hypothetical protein
VVLAILAIPITVRAQGGNNPLFRICLFAVLLLFSGQVLKFSSLARVPLDQSVSANDAAQPEKASGRHGGVWLSYTRYRPIDPACASGDPPLAHVYPRPVSLDLS